MKLVRENIEFKRGIKPKESLGISMESILSSYPFQFNLFSDGYYKVHAVYSCFIRVEKGIPYAISSWEDNSKIGRILNLWRELDEYQVNNEWANSNKVEKFTYLNKRPKLRKKLKAKF